MPCDMFPLPHIQRGRRGSGSLYRRRVRRLVDREAHRTERRGGRKIRLVRCGRLAYRYSGLRLLQLGISFIAPSPPHSSSDLRGKFSGALCYSVVPYDKLRFGVSGHVSTDIDGGTDCGDNDGNGCCVSGFVGEPSLCGGEEPSDVNVDAVSHSVHHSCTHCEDDTVCNSAFCSEVHSVIDIDENSVVTFGIDDCSVGAGCVEDSGFLCWNCGLPGFGTHNAGLSSCLRFFFAQRFG